MKISIVVDLDMIVAGRSMEELAGVSEGQLAINTFQCEQRFDELVAELQEEPEDNTECNDYMFEFKYNTF